MQAFFVSFSILVISRDIIQKTKVTSEILRASICVYLMIGFLWGTFYEIIYLLNTSAFSNISPEKFSQELGYFSFITLTTLGYGDVTPVDILARNVAMTEAIIGQLFPAIFIARLVGLYQAKEPEN